MSGAAAEAHPARGRNRHYPENEAVKSRLPSISRILVLFVLLLGLAVTLLGKGPGVNFSGPVTSLAEDFDSDTDPVTLRLQSDTQGPYKNGVDGVVSQLQSGGDWELNLAGSTARSVQVDLSHPASAGTTAPFASANVAARFITKDCPNNSLGGMTGNSSPKTCGLAVVFPYNGLEYRLVFDPFLQADTSWILVTCTAASPSTNSCTAWTLEAGTHTSNSGEARARLLLVQTTKGKSFTLVPQGDFTIPFRIHVTKP